MRKNRKVSSGNERDLDPVLRGPEQVLRHLEPTLRHLEFAAHVAGIE